MDLAERIGALDIGLFDAIESETSGSDRRSLLALHAALAEVHGTFSYLEVGSHLGGSLQVLVRDPRATRLVSIDPRPPSQPDERGERFVYEGNSTARMIDRLAALPGADLAKLEPLEAGTDALDPREVRGSAPPALCFVDGEHTDGAVDHDARFCRAVVADRGAVAFHDTWIVHRGLLAWLQELRTEPAWHRTYLLPDSILVVEFGPPVILETSVVTEQVRDGYWGYLALAGLLDERYTLRNTAPS